MDEYRREDPTFLATADMVIKPREGPEETFTSTLAEPPRELMDQAEALLGNAQARVTVSAEMSGPKDFGNGVSARVSVSLACNQDMQTIQNAMGLANQISRYYVQQIRNETDQQYQPMLAALKAQRYGG